MLDFLFAPKASRQVLAALRALGDEFESGPPGHMAFQSVREMAARDIGRSPKRLAATLAHYPNPRNVALMTLIEVSGNALASGAHHVYRGMLSMQGEWIRDVFYRAVDELGAAGIMSAEEVASSRNMLAERIAGAG